MEEELFKELYLYELTRKEELTGRVTVLLTAVTVVGALVCYLLKKVQPSAKDPFSLIFGSLLLLAFFFYGCSIYHLTRLYSGYTYQVIPTSAKLQAYYQELVNFYKDNPETEGDADSQFHIYLDKRYAEATEINASNNEAKAAYHVKSFRALVFTLVFTTLAAVSQMVRDALV